MDQEGKPQDEEEINLGSRAKLFDGFFDYQAPEGAKVEKKFIFFD